MSAGGGGPKYIVVATPGNRWEVHERGETSFGGVYYSYMATTKTQSEAEKIRDALSRAACEPATPELQAELANVRASIGVTNTKIALLGEALEEAIAERDSARAELRELRDGINDAIGSLAEWPRFCARLRALLHGAEP